MNSMSRLILVKHSLPEIDPARPAREWRLSDEGRRRCPALAKRLAEHAPEVVVASLEPKATETGQIVARWLGKPLETVAGLHEHERSRVGFLDADQFNAAVAALFNQPAQLVFGEETADQAHARFAGAVAGVMQRHARVNTAVIAHGTVIALLVSRAAGLEPFALWKRLGLPSFVVLAWPDLAVRYIVDQME